MPPKPSTLNNTIALVLIALTVFFTGAAIYLSMRRYSQQAKASQVLTLDIASLAPESNVGEGATTTEFSLYSEEGYIYKSEGDGLAAVVDFISKNPQVIEDNVMGASTTTPTRKIKTQKKILPTNFLANSYLSRKKDDSKDTFLKKQGFNLKSEHYYFRQKINNIPIYKASLSVHLKNANEVYALSGSVALNEQVSPAVISKSDAEKVALEKAKEEASNLLLHKSSTQDYVFNHKIMGLSDDGTNYPTLAVVVESEGRPSRFAKRYFVSLADNTILYTENLRESVLSRGIYTCDNGSTSCSLARQEGEAPVGEPDTDNTYTYLGDTYNYYLQTFQRDSFDNSGFPLDAFVNLTTQIECPNAFWTKAPANMFAICDGMSGKDVIAHEYTHAVTEYTADLLSTDQSGAMNEAMSDIFAYAIDTSNWTVGEDTTLGVIRHADDPGRDPANTGGPHPDRLYSPNYYCGTADDGGTHQNMSVPIKAFYLMTAGGSFNGCTINAVGRATAHAVFYRTLTTYLSPTSNFRSLYNSMLQSCGELFSTNPSLCNEVKKSMQAVEIDQQTLNTQTASSCANIPRQVPECATQSPTSTPAGPTATPTAGPSPTPTRIPTSGPSPTGFPTSTPQPQATSTPLPASPTPESTSTPRPTSTPKATPTRPPITADSIILHMKLKFQGILIKPPDEFNTMAIHVGVKHTGQIEPVFSDGDFIANAGGVWIGDVVINDATPGEDFFFYVKGPKHIQKRICTERPVETYDGTYICGDTGRIRLVKGDNTIDFSNVSLLSGDLPVQDGIANSYDLSTVRNFLGRTDAEALQLADVNLDGIIDTQDYSLILHSLAFRFDESPE
ncbi:MAG: hypothetical protein RI947_914 [Candidatus Parcubacteria bacterium]|jgi:Zn-dependent metalloprotease